MHTVHVTCVKKIHPPHHWTALNQPSLLITCPVWICMLQSLQIRLWQDDHYYTKVKACIITVKMANDIGSSSLRTRPSGHYAKAQWAHMFYWSWARNSQELIDSTTGVVLAPKVQPGPHQVMALSMGWMFCHPSQSQIPILCWSTKIKWLTQSHNSKTLVGVEPQTLGLGALYFNYCTKWLTVIMHYWLITISMCGHWLISGSDKVVDLQLVLTLLLWGWLKHLVKMLASLQNS